MERDSDVDAVALREIIDSVQALPASSIPALERFLKLWERMELLEQGE